MSYNLPVNLCFFTVILLPFIPEDLLTLESAPSLPPGCLRLVLGSSGTWSLLTDLAKDERDFLFFVGNEGWGHVDVVANGSMLEARFGLAFLFKDPTAWSNPKKIIYAQRHESGETENEPQTFHHSGSLKCYKISSFLSSWSWWCLLAWCLIQTERDTSLAAQTSWTVFA